MPVFHRGAKERCRAPPANCQGHPLDANHDEVACHAQGEKRNDIIRLLNCWIDTIEGDCSVKKKKIENPCMEFPLCYPEFSCKEGLPETRKRPICVTGDAPVSLLPETICYKEGRIWKLDEPPGPVWERPRVKSSQLIGGEFRKVHDCFRSNGLNDHEYCPRTESCEVMKCFNEMIEADRRLHGPEVIARDCCCRPGDAPSRMPQFKCTTCEPPSHYGYKDQKYPAEIGRHGEHHERHHHGSSCNHPHHQSDMPDKSGHHAKEKRRPLDKFNVKTSMNTPIQYTGCLNNKNPRSSAEIWQDDDLDIFGHHTLK